MTSGRSLELYFVDGDPDGMLTAEVFDWTGHILRIPRTRLADGLKRDEAGQTGVYILLGSEKDTPKAYIGEAENMRHRLQQHARDKDWWDQAVLITAARDALHKAHVKYLEAELISQASSAKASTLMNGNLPSGASLNEAATANMKRFLQTLHLVLSAIRVDIFQSGVREPTKTPDGSDRGSKLAVFEMHLAKHGISAQAELRGAELVVLAGSTARQEWIGKEQHNPGYFALFQELLEKGVLKQRNDHCVFTTDWAFKSPSAAAAIVVGRATNGRTSWKLNDGTSYADWETQQLSEAS